MAKQTASRPRSAQRSAPGSSGDSHPTRQPARWAHLNQWPVWAALVGLVVLFASGVVAFSRGGTTAGTSAGLAVLHTPDYHSLAFSPTDPNVVLFGHHNGVMRSDDGGHTFHALVSRTNFDAMNMAVNPTNSQQVYLAGHNVFSVSVDGGTSWQSLSTNLPGTDIHGFTMSPDDPGHLAAFVVGYGVFASPDAGHTWERLTGRLPGDVMSLVSAGGNPETLYAASMSAGIFRSTDGGASFAPVSASLGRMVYSLAVDPATRTTIYAGAEGGLFKSMDGGTNWTKLPYPAANAAVVGVSRAQPNRVLAIALKGQNGVVERSDDAGATWTTGH